MKVSRRIALKGSLLTAGMAVAGLATADPAQAAEGSLLIPGSGWLQGQGVNVYSNGGNTGGTRWQCVELPQRLYPSLYPKGTWPTVWAKWTGAYSIPEGSPGFTQHKPGSGYVPVPGDLIIEDSVTRIINGKSTKSWGHVAVVDYTLGNNIYAVEQNGAYNGLHTYLFNGSNYYGGSGAGPIKCILHAPQNNFKNPSDLSNAFKCAFQANTSSLYTQNSDSPSKNFQQGMAVGTSPGLITADGGKSQIAFQANTGALILVGDLHWTNTGLRMAPKTSPSITRLRNNRIVVAFQSNLGNLCIWDSTSGVTDLKLGMMRDTSPVICGRSHEDIFTVAFQANTGNLYTYSNSGGARNWRLGMRAGSSPAITMLNSGAQVAFQSNVGGLWTVGARTNLDTGLGMTLGTNPSITRSIDGTNFRIAFQNNLGDLHLYDSGSQVGTQRLGMNRASSPSIATTSSGYQVAFKANTGNLYFSGALRNMDTRLGMISGTSSPIIVGNI